MALTREGRLLGFRDSVVFDTGAYVPWGIVEPWIAATTIPGPYKLPAFRVDMEVIYTNKVPVTPVRGAGRPQAVFAMERMMDLAARELGLDPAEIRRRNFIQPEEMPFPMGLVYRDGAPVTYDSGDYPACLSKALELIGYDALRRAQSEAHRPDMGAYGGSLSDAIPFPVSGLSGAVSGPSIDLTWSSNPCSMIQGYKVFYSANKSGAPYDSTQDAGNVTSFTLGPLTAPTSTLTAPVLSSSPGSGVLKLTWTPSSGATGYNIFYKESSAAVYNPPIQVGNTNTFDLSGLTNPTPAGVVTYYDVYVQPYYQAAYHIAVKPYYNSTDANKLALVYSNEINVPFGSLIDGPVSNAITDFPEPITAIPALPNKGCFIATAAYGSYSASQVQALRTLRDRYLQTNKPGRALVRWYYTYGPRGAQILNDHPEWKPVVRAALLPAIGIALFLTHTSSLTKILFIMIFATSIVLLLYRKKLPPFGGIQ